MAKSLATATASRFRVDVSNSGSGFPVGPLAGLLVGAAPRIRVKPMLRTGVIHAEITLALNGFRKLGLASAKGIQVAC